MKKFIQFLFGLAGYEVVKLPPGGRYGKAMQPVTPQFLRSEEYAELMTRHVPCGGSWDRHEAQNETTSYRFRHFEACNRLGIFRWRGMQENLDFLLEIFADDGTMLVDFGGAACPLGFHSVLVDQLKRDYAGKPVPFHALSELTRPIDVFFSSHTFEHIPELEVLLEGIRSHMARCGRLIVQLPSFYCERWRAGVHRNELFNDHVWTFGLAGDPNAGALGLERYCEIDTLLKRFFDVERAEYCGDDSIFIVARSIGG